MTEAEWIRRVPWLFVVLTAGLCLLGLVAIARGDELFRLGEFAPRQRIWAMLSLGVFTLAAGTPYDRLRQLAWPLYGLCLVLLVVVFFMPAKNHAHCWIPLGLMDFQPSELAKLAFIAATARYLMHRTSFRRGTGLVVPFGLMLLPCVLILREPDLGTAMLFFPMLFAMLFAAGARLRHLMLVGVLGVLSLPVLWTQMSAEQKSRVVSVFNQQDEGEAPDDDGYHLHQSKRVLSLGGVWGSQMTGLTVANRRIMHLPESRTDFVFCLIGERWGLVGCLATLSVYGLLIARGLLIAAGTREPFGRLFVVGFLAMLASQTVINTAMTVGLLPITGITLPLVSYGGSSLMVTSLGLGLVVSVALTPDTEPRPEPFRFLTDPGPA